MEILGVPIEVSTTESSTTWSFLIGDQKHEKRVNSDPPLTEWQEKAMRKSIKIAIQQHIFRKILSGPKPSTGKYYMVPPRSFREAKQRFGRAKIVIPHPPFAVVPAGLDVRFFTDDNDAEKLRENVPY